MRMPADSERISKDVERPAAQTGMLNLWTDGVAAILDPRVHLLGCLAHRVIVVLIIDLVGQAIELELPLFVQQAFVAVELVDEK